MAFGKREPTPASSPAAADIQKFSAAREKLFARRAELEDELRNLEHSLGTVQLGDLVDDTSNAKPLLERASVIREAIGALDKARGPCETTLLDALRALNHETAVALRAQAGTLQRALDEHCARRLEMQRALESFAECDFDERLHPKMSDAPGATEIDRGGVPHIQAGARMSLARRLHGQILALMQEADRAERQLVHLPALPSSTVVVIAKAS